VENADAGVDTIVVDVVADSNAWMTHGKTFSLADYANVENIAANGDIYPGVPAYMGVHLVGNAGNNVVSGSFHDDILEGGAGDDLIEDSYSAIVKANAPLNGDADSLFGGDGNDRLISWSGNDRLDGGAGDDTLDGGSGNDVLDGGAGNDVVLFGIDDGQDILKQQSADSNPFALNVLRFKAGVGAADVLVKRWGANLELRIAGTQDKILVQGFYANNTALHAHNPMQRIEFADGTTWNLAQIEQLASTDFNVAPPTLAQPLVDMAFAPGDIAYVVPDTAFLDADAGDALSYTATLANGKALPAWLRFNANTLTFTGASDTIGTTSITVTATDKAGGSISDTFDMVISVPNLILNGTSAADTLIGGAGNDILNGGAGNDALIGAGGNDTYVVGSAGDVVTEAVNEGVDWVQSSVTYTLATNVENLTLTGTSAINATGNALDNVLTGNSAANVLTGGAGADTMVGGAGNDTYVVDNTGDAVIENLNEGTDLVKASVNYTLDANVENLTLAGTSALNGLGNALNNTLTGNAGANVLDGGAGADTLVGGAGNDTYLADNVGDVTTEAASAGTDLVVSSVNWTLAANLENLTLVGTANLNGVGNAIANTIIGNIGNNVLDGGAANDTLVGGLGDDTYVVNSASDMVTEAANEGVDLVQSNVTYTLSANVEDLTLNGTAAVNATGNALANVLKGNSANNTLTASVGNDTLDGGAGADSLIGGTGNDIYLLNRGYGSDTITENDTTSGNTDVLQFLSGISSDQLWFRHSGNNLEVSIIGTTDKATLSNWYSGNPYHVEQFKTSDGKMLLDSQVQNLVSAMAAFAPPAPGQTTLSASYATALTPVIVANWQ
jgi:Ca2+-binding RTX toxin-like protein